MGGAAAVSGRVGEDVIEANGLGLGASTQRFIEVASTTGYSVVATGPNRFRLARTYRPMWASVMALTTAVFLGLGLFFLLVKRTETGDAVIVEDRSGVKLRLTGTLHPQLAEGLRVAFARSAMAPPSTSPSSGFMPVAARSAEPMLPRPVEQPVSDAQPVLILADGRSIAVGAGAVIGRNPELDPRLPAAQLVTINDPSLSKTHATVGPLPTGIWVVDHYSTNGTWVLSGGVASQCSPGVRFDVPFGAQVVIGEVRMTLDGRS